MTNTINPRSTVQFLECDKDCLKFQVPFAMSISGPSQSGKSRLICALIENRSELFTQDFDRIIFAQHESVSHQHCETFESLQKTFPNVEFVSGLPDISKLRLHSNPTSSDLIIIDDLQSDFLDSQEMLHLLRSKSQF